MKTNFLFLLIGLLLIGQRGFSQVTVRFTVDMTGQIISDGGMHIAGDFATNGSTTILSDWSPDAAGSELTPITGTSFTIAVSFPSSSAGNSLQFKLIRDSVWNDGYTEWDEGLYGDGDNLYLCGISNGFGGYNRDITIPSSDADYTCVWNQCGLFVTSSCDASLSSNNYGSFNQCPGNSLTIYTNYDPSDLYQWSLDGNAISDATDYNYTASGSGNYAVSVTNAQGCSASNSAEVSQQCTPPAGLYVFNIKVNAAQVGFIRDQCANSSNIRYKESGGNWTHVTSSSNYISLKYLSPSTEYTVEAQTNCTSGDSSGYGDPVTFTTPACAPPSNLYTIEAASTAAKVAWTPANAGIGYTIVYRVQSGNVSTKRKINSIYGTSTTLWNLLPGTTYSWAMQTQCTNSMHSALTDEQQFTTASGSKLLSETNNLSLDIYPNPSGGKFTVSVYGNDQQQTKIMIMDMVGNVVDAEFIGASSSKELNLSDKPAGVYFLKIISGNETKTTRLEVTK